MVFHTGCAGKEDSPNMPSIFFIPQAEGGDTRAYLIDSAEDIDHFLVWGNYDGNVVFNDTQVSKKGNEWVYEPLQYWNMNATQYEFYAYTPIEAGTPEVVDNHQWSVSGIDSKNNPVDLVMAYTQVPQVNFGQDVNLNFKHALAAVNFSFQLREGYTYTNTYDINNIRWNNVYTQGTFTMNRGTIRATPTGTLGTSNAVNVNTNLLVIPQTTEATLAFSLNINDENKEITKNISIDWEPGHKYNYNIIIDPYEIVIEATEWETININQNITIGQ